MKEEGMAETDHSLNDIESALEAIRVEISRLNDLRTWEYEIAQLDSTDSDIVSHLDARGDYGWELVSVVPAGADYFAFFKKPRV
jgi:hypothetical protein